MRNARFQSKKVPDGFHVWSFPTTTLALLGIVLGSSSPTDDSLCLSLCGQRWTGPYSSTWQMGCFLCVLANPNVPLLEDISQRFAVSWLLSPHSCLTMWVTGGEPHFPYFLPLICFEPPPPAGHHAEEQSHNWDLDNSIECSLIYLSNIILLFILMCLIYNGGYQICFYLLEICQIV